MVDLSKEFDTKNLGLVRIEIFKDTAAGRLFINYNNEIFLISSRKVSSCCKLYKSSFSPFKFRV